MGQCKSDMKPSTAEPTKDGDKGVFGKLKRKKPKADEPDHARTFADFIERADERLSHLITQKETELKSESGREEYNRTALARLRAMAFHLDEVINLAVDYSNS